MLLLCCILSKCYKAALSVLDSNIYCVDKKATLVEGKDIRLYYYYGGIIYAAVKDFSRSQEFFTRVLAFPAIVSSSIMVEAYKKFVLVSLLLDGTVPSIGKFTNNSFARQVKQISTAYSELMRAYETHSFSDVELCISNNTEAFIKDGNLGLVKQVLKSLIRKNLARLTKTYVTLSVDNIAEKAKLPEGEVESILLSMIGREEIFAKISQNDGMVKFEENPNRYNTQETMEILDRHLSYTIDLNNFLSDMDDDITLSTEFVQKSIQSKRGKFGPTGMMGEERFDLPASDFRG
eukprot:TRINITY_DN4037_c0_g1_i1.p1 TRINITY_DN4037_c0_g1~~TRINITY_DN4037_c0_g1_i1.p1  ORF type:complete len:292 (+),score=56.17 TRINITY_DN4037_c0_g1_i1:454-1329(+)